MRRAHCRATLQPQYGYGVSSSLLKLKQKTFKFMTVSRHYAGKYSLINMRQLHILFNSAKTWHVIVCWFLCFALNLPELSLKLFFSDVQNNFKLSSGKFGAKDRNQQTITCQVLAELNKMWSCLIFTKLYEKPPRTC